MEESREEPRGAASSESPEEPDETQDHSKTKNCETFVFNLDQNEQFGSSQDSHL